MPAEPATCTGIAERSRAQPRQGWKNLCRAGWSSMEQAVQLLGVRPSFLSVVSGLGKGNASCSGIHHFFLISGGCVAPTVTIPLNVHHFVFALMARWRWVHGDEHIFVYKSSSLLCTFLLIFLLLLFLAYHKGWLFSGKYRNQRPLPLSLSYQRV